MSKSSHTPKGKRRNFAEPLSIDELYQWHKDQGTSLSNFTTTVIHNGYSEVQFTEWLEARATIDVEAPTVGPN
jgi:hypothetical protein